MAIKTLTAIRYPKGGLVASVASADAVSVQFDDQYIQTTSLTDRGNYGSQFIYMANPAMPIRCMVTQTAAQVRASFGW